MHSLHKGMWKRMGGNVNGVGRGSEDKKDKNTPKIATRETVGMTFLLFSAMLLLIVATGPLLFGDIGMAITAFFLGFAGYYVYFLFLALIYLSIFMIGGKNFLPKGWVLRSVLLVTSVFLIVHTATAAISWAVFALRVKARRRGRAAACCSVLFPIPCVFSFKRRALTLCLRFFLSLHFGLR